MQELLRIHPKFELQQQLVALYQEIAKLRHLQVCNYSALSLEKIGFIRREGWFMVDIPHQDNRDKILIPHAWAEDMIGRVELVGEQFNPFLHQHNQIPAGIVIVTPDHPMYKRYTVR